MSLMSVDLKICEGVKKVLGEKHFTNEVNYDIVSRVQFMKKNAAE